MMHDFTTGIHLRILRVATVVLPQIRALVRELHEREASSMTSCPAVDGATGYAECPPDCGGGHSGHSHGHVKNGASEATDAPASEALRRALTGLSGAPVLVRRRSPATSPVQDHARNGRSAPILFVLPALSSNRIGLRQYVKPPTPLSSAEPSFDPLPSRHLGCPHWTPCQCHW